MDKHPVSSGDVKQALAYKQNASWVSQEHDKLNSAGGKENVKKASSDLNSQLGISAISNASSTVSQGVLDALATSKPRLNELGHLEKAAIQDPEAMMLYIGSTQTKLQQKSILSASNELKNIASKNTQTRAIRQDKLEERADEMRKAQEAAKKAGFFGKLAGAFGISGGVLTVFAGVLLTATPTPFAVFGPGMIAAGSAMAVSATVQTASPETYQKVLELASYPLSLALQGAGMSEEQSKMAGMAASQLCLSGLIAGYIGPVGAITASVGGGVMSGVSQVGMAASDIKVAKHQEAADELRAKAEEFSKMLALNQINEENTRKFMKTMMDNVQAVLDTVMSALQDTQASKKSIVDNFNQTQTVI